MENPREEKHQTIRWRFKEEKNDAERQIYRNKLNAKHPGMIYIILNVCEKFAKTNEIGSYNSYYIVDPSSSLSHFQREIRKSIKLRETETMILFFGERNGMPTLSENMGNINKKYGDVDGFLYVHVTGENTFG